MERKNKTNKCYVSGKITGLPCEVYVENFDTASNEVRGLGYNPINPIYNGLYDCAPYWLHMFVDILMLIPCKAIYMQTNWGVSRGSRIEHRLSKIMRKRIIYQYGRNIF